MRKKLIAFIVMFVAVLFLWNSSITVNAINNVFSNNKIIMEIEDNEIEDEEIEDEEDNEDEEIDDEEDNEDEEDKYDEMLEIEESKISDIFIDVLYAERIRVALNKDTIDSIINQGDLDSIVSLDLSCEKDSESCVEEFRGTKFLRNLEALNLENNSNFDEYEIATLNKLKYLNINNCSVYDLSELGELLLLEKLIISNNEISDLSLLENSTNLVELDASGNSFKASKGLEKLVKLEILNLSNSELRDINNLTSLTKLKNIDLDNTKISSITALADLINLEYLSLNNTRVTNIDSLGKCLNLKSLKINREFDGKTNGISNIEVLKNLDNLAILELENQSIGDMSVFKDGFVSLTTLKLNNQYHVEIPVSPEVNEVSIKNDYFRDNDGKSITPNTISDSGSYNASTNIVNWKDFGAVDELTFTVVTNSKIDHKITGHIIIPLGIPMLSVEETEVEYYLGEEISEEEFFDDIGVDIKLIKTTNAYGTITSNFLDIVNFDEIGEYEVTVSATASNGDVLKDIPIKVTISDSKDLALTAADAPDTGYDSSMLILFSLLTVSLIAVSYINRQRS